MCEEESGCGSIPPHTVKIKASPPYRGARQVLCPVPYLLITPHSLLACSHFIANTKLISLQRPRQQRHPNCIIRCVQDQPTDIVNIDNVQLGLDKTNVALVKQNQLFKDIYRVYGDIIVAYYFISTPLPLSIKMMQRTN